MREISVANRARFSRSNRVLRDGAGGVPAESKSEAGVILEVQLLPRA